MFCLAILLLDTGVVKLFLSWQKAQHPHLVSKWRDNTDLSKLAWPLMEEAKKLEREEGPGDVQVF